MRVAERVRQNRQSCRSRMALILRDRHDVYREAQAYVQHSEANDLVITTLSWRSTCEKRGGPRKVLCAYGEKFATTFEWRSTHGLDTR
jgi:hypothetical protein